MIRMCIYRAFQSVCIVYCAAPLAMTAACSEAAPEESTHGSNSEDNGISPFVTDLSDGTLAWLKQIGGLDVDLVWHIAMGPDDAVFTVGSIHRSDESDQQGDVTVVFGQGEANETMLAQAGLCASQNGLAYVARHNPDGTLAWVQGIHPKGSDEPGCQALLTQAAPLSNGAVMVQGMFHDTVVFDLGGPHELSLGPLPPLNYQEFWAVYGSDGTFEQAGIFCSLRSTDEGCYLSHLTPLADDSLIVLGRYYQRVVLGAGQANEIELVTSCETHCDGEPFMARYTAEGQLLWAQQLTRAPLLGEFPEDRFTVIPDNQGGFVLVRYREEMAAAGWTAMTFLTRFAPHGDVLWETRVTDFDDGLAMTAALTTNGGIVLAGYGAADLNDVGTIAEDALGSIVVSYSAQGERMWAQEIALEDNSGEEGWTALHLDQVVGLADGSIGVLGYFSRTIVFGKGQPDVLAVPPAGRLNAVLARYKADGTLLCVERISNPGRHTGDEVTASTHDTLDSHLAGFSDGSWLVVGDFYQTIRFNVDQADERTLTTAGGPDIFLARYTF